MDNTPLTVDNHGRAVEGQNSSPELAENPCQASEVAALFIYVTGNGDPHRTQELHSGDDEATRPRRSQGRRPRRGHRPSRPGSAGGNLRAAQPRRSGRARGPYDRRQAIAATREPSEAPPTHTWGGLVLLPVKPLHLIHEGASRGSVCRAPSADPSRHAAPAPANPHPGPHVVPCRSTTPRQLARLSACLGVSPAVR